MSNSPNSPISSNSSMPTKLRQFFTGVKTFMTGGSKKLPGALGAGNLSAATAAHAPTFAQAPAINVNAKYSKQIQAIKDVAQQPKSNKEILMRLPKFSENGLKALLKDMLSNPDQYGTPQQQKNLEILIRLTVNSKLHANYAKNLGGNFLTKGLNHLRKYAPFIFPALAIGGLVGGLEGYIASEHDEINALNSEAGDLKDQASVLQTEVNEVHDGHGGSYAETHTEHRDAFLAQHAQQVYTADPNIPDMGENNKPTPELQKYAEQLAAEGKTGRFANPDNNVSITINESGDVTEITKNTGGTKSSTSFGNGNLTQTPDGRLIGNDLRRTDDYQDAEYADSHPQAERDLLEQANNLRSQAAALREESRDINHTLTGSTGKFPIEIGGRVITYLGAVPIGGLLASAAGAGLSHTLTKEIVGMNAENVGKILTNKGAQSFNDFQTTLNQLKEAIQQRINVAQTTQAAADMART